ncbi:MAG: hypothetical protein ACYCPT_01925 [Acidimicrobiales bacterium]
MNWKHYLAILVPYAAAAALGIAEYMQRAQNGLEVSLGGLLVAVLSHGNVLGHANANTSHSFSAWLRRPVTCQEEGGAK